ncbi:cytokinesis protein sepH [Ceratobasidium sp. AG-Ba]|nr:cytokinesis protein sepH [Ceratobasidium sp. AG-Ba]
MDSTENFFESWITFRSPASLSLARFMRERRNFPAVFDAPVHEVYCYRRNARDYILVVCALDLLPTNFTHFRLDRVSSIDAITLTAQEDSITIIRDSVQANPLGEFSHMAVCKMIGGKTEFYHPRRITLSHVLDIYCFLSSAPNPLESSYLAGHPDWFCYSFLRCLHNSGPCFGKDWSSPSYIVSQEYNRIALRFNDKYLIQRHPSCCYVTIAALATQPQAQSQPQRLPTGRQTSEHDFETMTQPGSIAILSTQKYRINSTFEGIPSEERLADDLLPQMSGHISSRTFVLKEDGQSPICYSIDSFIGKGRVSTVYSALNLTTKQMVAVKRFALNELAPNELKYLKKEVNRLRGLSHANIVEYAGVVEYGEYLNLVLNSVKCVPLDRFLKVLGRFEGNVVAGLVTHVLAGLDYLHQSFVAHRNLKPTNILVTETGGVKLTDFGVSLNLITVDKVAGTPEWTAPELTHLGIYSAKSDIWSLGCIIVEMLTGHPPYGEITSGPIAVLRMIAEESLPAPEIFSSMQRSFLELVSIGTQTFVPPLLHYWNIHGSSKNGEHTNMPVLGKMGDAVQQPNVLFQPGICLDLSVENGRESLVDSKSLYSERMPGSPSLCMISLASQSTYQPSVTTILTIHQPGPKD